VAETLAPIVRSVLGDPPPVRIEFWDGSELGSSDASAARLSAVFSAPLRVVDDRLVCIRDALNAETSLDRVIRPV